MNHARLGHVNKPVHWTAYARGKLVFLREHGFDVPAHEVIRTVLEPDRVVHGHTSRRVAQRVLSDRHLLRVVYEESAHECLIITLSPARRSRYESTHDL